MALSGVVAPSYVFGAATTLVSTGAVWKYLDTGVNQGTNWRNAAFDDSGWSTGPAQLGYGDGDEATLVGFGGNPSNRFITTYFRKTINVTNPAAFSALTLRTLVDDGAVVYINGTEVARPFMPAGGIVFTNLAAATTENALVTNNLSPGLLVVGANVIAVEVHQDAVSSPDLSFDLELTATSTPQPLILTSISVSGGNTTITVQGEPGSSVTVEGAGDLIAWTPLLTATLTGGTLQVTDPSVVPARYYRARNQDAGTVYSVNVLGYVNLNVPVGTAYLANPLFAVTNSVEVLLSTVPDGTIIYKWNGTGYTVNSFNFGFWDDPSMTLVPGEGFRIDNPLGSPFTITFAGEVLQGTLVNPLPAGSSLRSSKVPQTGTLDDLGFPADDGDWVELWNTALQAFDVYTYFAGFGWDPTVPTLRVGESFFAHKSVAANWTRTFTVDGGGGPSLTIFTPPQSQSVVVGTGVTFSVVAGGTPPLSYQWRKDGGDIIGATATDYTIGSAQFSDAGDYTVVVTDSSGSITSAVATLTVSPPPVAHIWNGGSGDWSVATNWTPNGVPGPSDNVFITNSGTYTVTISASSSVSNLTVGAISGLQTLVLSGGTLTLEGTATVAANGSVVISGGTINGGTVIASDGGQLVANSGTLNGVTLGTDINIGDNSGLMIANGLTLVGGTTITLNSSGNPSLLNVNAGTQTIGGNGQIVFAGASPSQALRLGGGGATTLTLGAGITVRGQGSIDNVSPSTLVNQGTIQMDVPGQTLIINVNSITNSGTLRVTGGGMMNVSSLASGTMGGTVEMLGSASALMLSGVDYAVPVSGVTIPAGASLTLNGNWSNAGVLTLDGGTLTLGGTFTQAGLGTFNRTGGTVNLAGTINGGVALDAATGSWKLLGEINGGSVTALGGARLLIINGGTLNGVTLGTDINIGDNSGLMIANGLTLVGGTTITLNSSGNPSLLNVNAGTQTIGGNGQIVFAGASPSQALRLGGGGATTLTLGAGITVRGQGSIDNVSPSTLVNQGTIQMDVPGQTLIINVNSITNSGTLRSRSGILAVNGEFTPTSNSVIAIDIGGPTPGTQHGQVQVTGAVTLAGSLNVQLVNGFFPGLSNTFTVMTYGSHTGTFANLTGDGSMFQPQYNPTALVLTVLPAVGRAVEIGRTNAAPGASVAVPLRLLAQGNENALSFSIAFDASVLTFSNATLASGASAALLLLNTNQAASGKVGFNLALSAGNTFAAGTQELVVVRFGVSAGIGNTTATISFGDQPVAREVADAQAIALPATYLDGSVTPTAPPPVCVPPPSSLVSWWSMNGNASDIADGNNPSATNAISFTPSRVGQGVTFGAGGFIEIPQSTNLAIQTLTIDAWVRPDGPGPNNDAGGSVIFQKNINVSTGIQSSVELVWRAIDNRFLFDVYDVGVLSSQAYAPGQFYHVAGTHDGATVRLYVNGVLSAEQTRNGAIVYDASVPYTIGANFSGFRANGFARTWNGVIDEAHLFNHALTSNEIAAIYLADNLGVCDTIAPSIRTQPLSQTMSSGGTANLSVGANGTQPLRYQWRKNGVNLPGETNDTLTIANAQAANSGIYTVVVANQFGVVISDKAELRISVPPTAAADNFSGPAVLSGPGGVVSATNTFATSEPGEPLHAGKPGGKSVWFTWTAPATGITTFDTQGSDFDTLLAVYTGVTLSSLIEIASDDDRGDFYTSRVRLNAVMDTTYLIAVDGLGGASGNIVLSWNLEVTPDPLPRFITQPVSQTVLPGEPVTLTVSVTSPAPVTFQWYFHGEPIAGATDPTLLLPNVQEADTGSYTVLATSGSRSALSEPAIVQISSLPENVQVGASAHDKFLDAASVPINQSLALASVGRRIRPHSTPARGFTGTQIFSTYGAQAEEGEPIHCGVLGGASQWFSYQAPADGLLTINTDGSTFDTVVAVYTGPGDSFATLVSVACDNTNGLDGLDSAVTFAAVKDTVYFIAVDGVGGASGTVYLNYALTSTVVRFGAIRLVGSGSFSFQVTGSAGRNLILEWSSNLVVWNPLLATNIPPDGLTLSQPIGTGNGARFFRAVLPP